MNSLFTYLTGAALIATTIVLIFGIIGMLRTPHDPKKSNKWMRLRVIFQAVALLFFAALLLSRH